MFAEVDPYLGVCVSPVGADLFRVLMEQLVGRAGVAVEGHSEHPLRSHIMRAELHFPIGQAVPLPVGVEIGPGAIEGVGVAKAASTACRSITTWRAQVALADSAMNTIDSTDIGSHDANPGGDYYPFANAWASGEDERSHFVSTGFETGLGSGYRLGLRYSYGLTKTRVGYAAASAAALTGSLAGSSISGSFDELRFQQQILEANLRGQLTKQLSWRLYALYEAGQIDDFHYDGIRYADRAKMLLGTEVDDWDAHVVGLLAQYRF